MPLPRELFSPLPEYGLKCRDEDLPFSFAESELGLPPRQKNELNKSDRYFSWLPITKSRIKKYPYMGVATMALGAIIFLVSGGANSIN